MKKVIINALLLFAAVTFAKAQHYDIKARVTPTTSYEMTIDISGGVATVSRWAISNDLTLRSGIFNYSGVTFDSQGHWVLPDGNTYFLITFSPSHDPVKLNTAGGICECYCWGSSGPDHSCYVDSHTNDCAGGCTDCLEREELTVGGTYQDWKDGAAAIVGVNQVLIR